MMDVAAAFGGGLLIRQTLEDIQLPQLRRVCEETMTFKLSVRAVAASVPVLAKPGWMSRQRPRLEVTIGDAQKETELADYEEGGSSGSGSGACSSKDCPWRFGDTLTFKVGLKEVLGPGVRLKLRALSDIMLGPVQLQMSRVDEVGEACIDLRRRALPGCVPRKNATGPEAFESPLIVVPLSHVKGGMVGDAQSLGQAVAHVAISFVIDTDPEIILAAADAETRTVSETLAMKADGLMRGFNWFNAPEEPANSPQSLPSPPVSGISEDGLSGDIVPEANGLRTLTPGEAFAASDRARGRGVPAVQQMLQGPDLEPDGWISRKGPNGRYHWHHRSLGPAPWEEELSSGPAVSGTGRVGSGGGGGSRPAHSARSTSFGPILSGGLPQENWTCLKGPNGQTFWHNTALGPPPWEQGSAGGQSCALAASGGAKMHSKLATLPEGLAL